MRSRLLMVPHLVLENIKTFKEQRKVRFLNSISNISIKINKYDRKP